ncbi:MAG: hypothetical protein PVI53_11620 [Desulfobacteraceae bacterium]
MRLSENAHLPFENLMALSKVDPSTSLRVDAEQRRSIEGPFDRPFDRLTVLSKVEGLTVLSRVEGLRYPHPPPC